MDVDHTAQTRRGRRGAPRAFLRTATCAALLAAPIAAQLSPLYPVPVTPGGLGNNFCAADLDLDGRTDVIFDAYVSSVTDATVVWMRALPEGGFAPQVHTFLGTLPRSLVVTDATGDGLPDVLACTYSNETFLVLAGTGGGMLGPVATYFVGGELTSVAAGDINGDGLPDVVTLSDDDGVALNVNYADGTGGFLATVHHPLAIKPKQLALADIDADGHLDAIFTGISGSTNLLSVAFGDGSGGFGAPVSRTIPPVPGNVVVDDLDGDGDLDLATPCQFPSGSGGVAIVRGDGMGGLSPAESWPAGKATTWLATGDLDGDGATDLVIADFSERQVLILPADGLGGYAPVQSFDAVPQPSAVVVTDASADGLPDVVAWNGAAALLLGDGKGGLLSTELHAVDESPAVCVADLDGDAVPELVSITNKAAFSVVKAGGAEGYLPPVLTKIPAGTGDPRDLAVGDVTGDGRPDALAAMDMGLLLSRNDGTGKLLPPQVLSGATFALNVELADLDGDGATDVLVSCKGPQGGLSGRIQCYFGADDFRQPPASFPTGAWPVGLAVGDVNEDGHVDVVTADQFGGGLSVLIGDGAGGLLPPVTVPLSPAPLDVVLADLDLDGHLDAVAAQHGIGTLTWFAGDGHGHFSPAGSWPLETSDDAGLAIADVDGDGWPDVVHLDGYASAIAVRSNNAAGGLLPAKLFAAGNHPDALALADLDGDHHPDVVAADAVYHQLASFGVLRNLGNFAWTDLGDAVAGAFGAPQLIGTGALQPGSPGDLRLFHARPGALAVLFVSGMSLPTPFKGGTLVPVPPLLHLLLTTNAAGSLILGWNSWPSSAPGQDWYFQYAIADAAAAQGVALSNALKAVEP